MDNEKIDELELENEEILAEKRVKRPLNAYAVASQLSFVVLTPLLLFIWGGTWLVDKFSLPQWLNVVFIITGIIVMISSLINYLMRIIALYGQDKKDKYRSIKTDNRDFDYYDENKKKKI